MNPVSSKISLLLLTALAVACAGGIAHAGDRDISRIMGSIDVPAGGRAGDIRTVNGSVRIGAHAVVAEAHAVNGGIALDRGATAASVAGVNGDITLAQDSHILGVAETVNGSLHLSPGAGVDGDLRNVNGGIRIEAAHVGGGIDTVNGDIELRDAQVDGDIVVERRQSHSSHERLPRIVIGAGSRVRGVLRFERPVQLYVSERATIGAVEGATPIRFGGEEPPQ